MAYDMPLQTALVPFFCRKYHLIFLGQCCKSLVSKRVERAGLNARIVDHWAMLFLNAVKRSGERDSAQIIRKQAGDSIETKHHFYLDIN